MVRARRALPHSLLGLVDLEARLLEGAALSARRASGGLRQASRVAVRALPVFHQPPGRTRWLEMHRSDRHQPVYRAFWLTRRPGWRNQWGSPALAHACRPARENAGREIRHSREWLRDRQSSLQRTSFLVAKRASAGTPSKYRRGGGSLAHFRAETTLPSAVRARHRRCDCAQIRLPALPRMAVTLT